MAKNAIIYAHYGANKSRIRLLEESVNRLLMQHGDYQVYILENILPSCKTDLPDGLIRKITYIRISGNPIIWQKEAIYNAGAAIALKDGVQNLIFLDSDIIPENSAWILKMETELERYDWVHGGKQVIYLNRKTTEEVLTAADNEVIPSIYAESRQYSDIRCWSSAMLVMLKQSRMGFPGGAWGVTRSAWEKYRQWDCHNIIGGGDLFHFNRIFRLYEKNDYALIGNLRSIAFDDLIHEYVTADPHWKIGYVKSRLYHLWHGEIDNRYYVTRYKILVSPEAEKLLKKKSPEFSKDQIISPETLISYNTDLLLDLNNSHQHYKSVLLKLAEYYCLMREDVNIATINSYLDHINAGFHFCEYKKFNFKTLKIQRSLRSINLS